MYVHVVCGQYAINNGEECFLKEHLLFWVFKLLRCRTTKLLSQKRRYLAVFCISFYWQRGPAEKKRRDYYLKNSLSNGILHQSHRKRMMWLRSNMHRLQSKLFYSQHCFSVLRLFTMSNNFIKCRPSLYWTILCSQSAKSEFTFLDQIVQLWPLWNRQ